MTLQEVNLYTKAVNRGKIANSLNTIGELRIAFHAEGKEYAKIIKQMKRDLE